MGKQDAFANALYEPNCQEGNYGIIGIMSSTRASERLFREGKGPDPATQDNASGGGGEDETSLNRIQGRCQMRNRCLAVMGALTIAACVALIPVAVAGQSAAAKTPWGEPDLQGIWYAFENVPLQRPAQDKDREFLTDKEAAERAGKPWIEQVAEGFEDLVTRGVAIDARK